MLPLISWITKAEAVPALFKTKEVVSPALKVKSILLLLFVRIVFPAL